MYLLDTDTLTHLQFGNSNVAEKLRMNEDSEFGITIVTKVEILRGRIEYLLKAEDGINLLKAQELLFRTEALLSDLLVIPVDRAASVEFDRLRTVSKFRKIGQADLLIASITLANRAVLVTRNLRHFKQIPGLRVENWVDS
jgi:tRNA(fMet)-specific endonuclease VapC